MRFAVALHYATAQTPVDVATGFAMQSNQSRPDRARSFSRERGFTRLALLFGFLLLIVELGNAVLFLCC